MYDKNVNYHCQLEVTVDSLISQYEKKYHVDANQAAYVLNKVLDQDIVACILIDRGLASVSDYLTACKDDDMK